MTKGALINYRRSLIILDSREWTNIRPLQLLPGMSVVFHVAHLNWDLLLPLVLCLLFDACLFTPVEMLRQTNLSTKMEATWKKWIIWVMFSRPLLKPTTYGLIPLCDSFMEQCNIIHTHSSPHTVLDDSGKAWLRYSRQLRHPRNLVSFCISDHLTPRFITGISFRYCIAVNFLTLTTSRKHHTTHPSLLHR